MRCHWLATSRWQFSLLGSAACWRGCRLWTGLCEYLQGHNGASQFIFETLEIWYGSSGNPLKEILEAVIIGNCYVLVEHKGVLRNNVSDGYC
jgi:hypothetical protein